MESSTPSSTHSVYRSVFRKYVSIGHQGKKDHWRHCDGSVHTERLATMRITKPVTTFMYRKDFNTDHMARLEK